MDCLRSILFFSCYMQTMVGLWLLCQCLTLLDSAVGPLISGLTVEISSLPGTCFYGSRPKQEVKMNRESFFKTYAVSQCRQGTVMGLLYIIQIKTPPSVLLNPNCVLYHLVSFYYIQVPGLLPNPIKKEHLWWLGNQCVSTVPQVILICSQGWEPLPYIKKKLETMKSPSL